MSLADNMRDVAFFGGSNIDKVVQIFEGSYNLGTDTTERTNGFLNTLKQFAIPHGFTRPVFTELFYSVAGNNYAPGGSFIDFGAITVSDSQNVYILSNDAFGFYPNSTMDYKIVCTWITDYDSSNPLVPEYQYPDNPFTFDGRANYQKVKQEGPMTYSAGTLSNPEVLTVDHNLGYRPNAKVWFEPIAGEVWPMNFGGVANPFLYDFSQDEMSMMIFDNTLEITAYRSSNATRRVWYKIYFDQ